MYSEIVNKSVGPKWSFPNGAELPSYTASFSHSDMMEAAHLHLKIVVMPQDDLHNVARIPPHSVSRIP
jgi:hypothetical protein